MRTEGKEEKRSRRLAVFRNDTAIVQKIEAQRKN
jgi:hypothetical protein